MASGADFIKIWYIVGPGQKAEVHYPLVQAVIQESHQAGQRVAVHATQLQTAKLAVKAGADILVHSVNDREVDSEFIRLLKEHRILYIPTLSVFEGYQEVLTRQMHFSTPEILLANPHFLGTLFRAFELPQTDFPTFSAEFVRQHQQQIPIARENLKRLHDAGVWIAAGTDAGNIGTLHGPAIFREFQLMQEAGLTPHQILTCATLNGARVMGMEEKLGSVEPGKLADLLILNSDPRRQVPNLLDYFAIIKDGHLFRPQEILHSSPGEVVQVQTNAYNARDLEAFLTTFGDTVKAYTFPTRVRFANIREMEEHYRQLFRSAPQLHAQIQNSTVLGNFVVNREHITGLPDGGISDMIVIYDVRDEKIQQLWFLGE
ncbi:MAG: hypothetical protein D6681_22805 [Calditrichaeota bacterium]|nr:MAG: hypothetical protein D6681_22805 [Calditrichota bacterium]